MWIEFTTDAARRNRTRMTATQREVQDKVGMGLAMQQAINAEMEPEGEAIWAEIRRQADAEVAR